MSYTGLDVQLGRMTSQVTNYFTWTLFFDLINVYRLSGFIATVGFLAVIIYFFERKTMTFLSVTSLVAHLKGRDGKERVSVDKVIKSNKF